MQKEFLDYGFEAIICCLQSDKLGEDWIGKQLNSDFFRELPIGVDPFGENGEFHTFCYNGPIFRKSVAYETGEVLFKPLAIKYSKKTENHGFIYLDIVQ